MQTADIVPRAAGDFKLQCHTAEHVAAGMIANFHVEDDGQSPVPQNAAFSNSDFLPASSPLHVCWLSLIASL